MALQNGCTGQELINEVNKNSTNLNLLIEDCFHVGDIRYSQRSTLGDKYLPCDGSEVIESEYADLYTILKDSVVKVPDLLQDVGSGVTNTFYHLNEYYIYTDGTCIYYKTTPIEEWCSVDIGVPTTSDLAFRQTLSYENGNYILFYKDDSGNLCVKYSKTIDGNWESNIVVEVSSIRADSRDVLINPGAVIYYNGYYFAPCSVYRYSAQKNYMAYAYSSSIDGTWSFVCGSNNDYAESYVWFYVENDMLYLAGTTKCLYATPETNFASLTNFITDKTTSTCYYHYFQYIDNKCFPFSSYKHDGIITDIGICSSTQSKSTRYICKMSDGYYYRIGFNGQDIEIYQSHSSDEIGLQIVNYDIGQTPSSFFAHYDEGRKSIVVFVNDAIYEFRQGRCSPFILDEQNYVYIKAKE